MKCKNLLLGTILCALILTNFNLNAQIKNSEEKPVASFFNAASNRIEFSGGETSFKQRIGKWYGKFLGEGSKDTTAVKVTGLFFKIGITETKKFIDFDDFDFGEKNGFLGGMELVHSFDKIYKNKDFRTHDLITFKTGVTGSYKRVKVLDTLSGNIKNHSPLTVNLNASIGYFWFRWKSSGIIGYPQLNIAYNVITYNEKELKGKFAQTESAIIEDDILIVDGGFDGVVGDYNNNVQVFDASFSFPWITEYDHKYIPNFMLSPYVSYQNFSYLKEPAFNLGTSITVLGKSFFGKKTDVNQAKSSSKNVNLTDPVLNSSFQAFKPPSFLTIGVDWGLKNGVKASKPNFYLSGSFNIN